MCIGKHAAVVFFPEYTLSPEVKFPVVIEEHFAVICWLCENANSINLNPDKTVISGDSAGGNMSTAISSK